ncbi:MAG: hypothetical protein ACSLEW_11300 [Nocardioides sp.]
MTDSTILAHGLGGARDLPISLTLAVLAGIWVLVISFVVLIFAWRHRRFTADTGRVAPEPIRTVVDSPAWAWLWRVFGLLGFGYCLLACLAGKDLGTNPIFGITYVWLWVGVPLASLFFGPVWKAISPIRTLHLLLSRAAGIDPATGIRDYPTRLGYWPAAVGLYAFVWMELVSPFPTMLGPLTVWLGAYTAIMLVGSAVYGERFLSHGDPFEVYSTLVSRLSVWGRDVAGTLVLRNPLANLDTVRAAPGLVAVVSVLFGSTIYDSFGESATWLSFSQDNDFVRDHPSAPDVINNLGLIGFILAVAGIFMAAAMLTGIGPERRRRDLPAEFANSIVPIIVGYIFAHYLTYLVLQGQNTLILVSDPLGTGADWFGTADYQINYWLAQHPTLLAVIKVSAVIIGHVIGVITAHERSLTVLPKQHQVVGQLPLLFAMLFFTGTGIYLLFAT